jgi:hypothetical protein
MAKKLVSWTHATWVVGLLNWVPLYDLNTYTMSQNYERKF